MTRTRNPLESQFSLGYCGSDLLAAEPHDVLLTNRRRVAGTFLVTQYFLIALKGYVTRLQQPPELAKRADAHFDTLYRTAMAASHQLTFQAKTAGLMGIRRYLLVLGPPLQ